jgi:hypothetical protein
MKSFFIKITVVSLLFFSLLFIYSVKVDQFFNLSGALNGIPVTGVSKAPTPQPTEEPPATPAPANGRVNFGGIVIDYAKNWQPFLVNQIGGSENLTMEIPNFYGIVVGGVGNLNYPGTGKYKYYQVGMVLLEKPIPPSSNLKDLVGVSYNSTNFSNLYAKVLDVKLNGIPAIQRNYMVYTNGAWYEIADFWIQKDGIAYIISCRAEYTNQDDLADPGFLTILNSVQVN